MQKLLKYLPLCLLIFSCRQGNETAQRDAVLSSQQEEKQAPNEQRQDLFKSAVADTAATPPGSGSDMVLSAGQPPRVVDWDKKIIKTAKVTLELKDYHAYDNDMHLRLKSFGAYVAQENQQEHDYRIQNDLVIKVPADRFEDLLNSLGGKDIKLLEKNISSQDVTGEVIDNKARIEAKKQVRARYLELLKQAKNMEEILQVQNEINSIQEDLEAASGRVGYLTHAAAYSTLQLSYYQLVNDGNQNNETPGIGEQVLLAFKSGAQVLVQMFLMFISVWPLLLGASLLFVFFRRWKKRRLTGAR